MHRTLNYRTDYLLLLVLAPLFFWFTHYLAVFPHEYAHSLVASLFGFKEHFWQIDYGGQSFWNIAFLIHIDENVNYAAMHAANKDWLIALAAFAGPGIANGFTYFFSLWLLAKRNIQAKKWLFYFIFWWNANSIGNFIDYVPSRTFASHGDMAHLAHGLHISPWWIMTIIGYTVIAVVWYFYTNTLTTTYRILKLADKYAQATLLIIITFVLFLLYGTVGLNGYGAISHFISQLSVWMVAPIIAFSWPWRAWVRALLSA